jgi:hypothetical protein
MASVYFDIFLCLATYMILIGFIIWHKRSRNRPDDNGSDGDGGLPIESGPKLDLPPGVCLPSDGPTIIKKEQFEDALY